MKTILLFAIILTLISPIITRIHRLDIHNEDRRDILLSKFGFNQGGYLDVHILNFHAMPKNSKALFGFSLIHTPIISGYDLQSDDDYCILRDETPSVYNVAITTFSFDLDNKMLKIKCNDDGLDSSSFRYIHIYNAHEELRKTKICKDLTFNMTITSQEINDQMFFNIYYRMEVETTEKEGLYYLYLHNCHDKNSDVTSLTYEAYITETNIGSFISAGKRHLPALYYMQSLMLFMFGIFWVLHLKSSHPILKLHQMMTAFVFLKSFSLFFHGVYCYFIKTLGVSLVPWAVLFHSFDLLTNILLFAIILFVGTSWTYGNISRIFKNKMFIIAFISLQVLVNTAEIIMEENQIGSRIYDSWETVYIIGDLLCCVLLIVIVILTIRKLKKASSMDTTISIKIKKLTKLLKYFYIVVVIYIYCTRIIVSILKCTLNFQYEWFVVMFKEMLSLIFFMIITYMFKPTTFIYFKGC